MHVGTQLKARNDDDYRVFAQLGVNHICGYPPGDPKDWNEGLLTSYREHLESFGLNLDFWLSFLAPQNGLHQNFCSYYEQDSVQRLNCKHLDLLIIVTHYAAT